MGLAGYPELQEQVRGKLLKELRAPEASAQDGAASHLGQGIAAKSLYHDVEILATTMRRTDPEDVDRAILVLSGAQRLRVIGGMTSFSIAYYAAVALDRVRPEVILVSGEPLPTGPLLDVGRGDAVLAFSFPPYAKSTLDAVRAEKSRGASIVALSDSPISPLRDVVDVLLPAVVAGVGMQNSYVAAMALTNVIANGVALTVPEALERYSETVQLLADWDVYLLQPGKED
jgi:DNA-binding MurR/RpiR family transcriptional regulator